MFSEPPIEDLPAASIQPLPHVPDMPLRPPTSDAEAPPSSNRPSTAPSGATDEPVPSLPDITLMRAVGAPSSTNQPPPAPTGGAGDEPPPYYQANSWGVKMDPNRPNMPAPGTSQYNALPMREKMPDTWNAEKYQLAGSFVPKKAEMIIKWLDVKPGDVILDVGCGDGEITIRLCQKLDANRGGQIHGMDKSTAMIAKAKENLSELAAKELHTNEANLPPNTESFDKETRSCSSDWSSHVVQFSVNDAATIEVHGVPKLFGQNVSGFEHYDKIFSNAAFHWILAHKPSNPITHYKFFQSLNHMLKQPGFLVFEMGVFGNIAEAHAALVACTMKRLPRGMRRIREIEPWFFPDEAWIRYVLKKTGFKVDELEVVDRPTEPTKFDPKNKFDTGLEGWIRFFGKDFIDEIEDVNEREEVIREVKEVLEHVCMLQDPDRMDDKVLLGYKRIRVKAQKIETCKIDDSLSIAPFRQVPAYTVNMGTRPGQDGRYY